MQHYVKVYTDYFKIAMDDKPLCEVCKIRPLVEVHHINGRGKGKDIISNLIGVCRECHHTIHFGSLGTMYKKTLTTIHENNLNK